MKKNLNKIIKKFDIKEWKVSHFPNAINLSHETEDTIRLTTTTVYPIYGLIKLYQNTDFSKHRDSFEDSFILDDQLKEDEKDDEENKQ